MTERIPSVPAPASLRAQVARALRLDPADVGLDDDLVDLGLESTALIRLAGRWRRDGLAADFSRLAADPTIRAWARMLGEAAADGYGDGAGVGGGADPVPRPAAPALDPASPSPLTPLQHAYWLGRQPGQPSGSVAAHFYVELDGADLDPERLRAALAALVARHASLRMRFRDDGTQQPLPADEEPPAARLRIHDLRAEDADAVDARLERMRHDGTHRRMAVERGEVLRVDLTLLPFGRSRLHVDLDMLAGDAISLRVLLADLRDLVEEPGRQLPAIHRDVRAELAARAARADASRTSADARWWRERVPDLPAGPALPVRDDAERADAEPRSRRLHHRIGQQELRLLEAAARARGLTVAAVLATAFAEVVAAWSAEGRFLLNLPVLDRGDEEGLELVVGEFSTSILLDVDLREERSFQDDARRIQRGVREAVAHAGYGGVDVLRDLARRDGGSPVLAPVVYTSAIGLGELYDASIRRALGEPVWIISQGPQVWLDAQVTELDGGLLLNWDVRVDILEERAMEAAFAAYRQLVDGLAHERPGAWETPALAVPAPEDARARRELERPAPGAGPLVQETPDTGDGLLHSAFLARAAADPGRPAVIGSDGHVVAYGELAENARRVAGLLRARGVRSGETVAITAPAGPDRVAAVLGVLLAGACYAPVGPDQPPARRAMVLARGIDCVLADDGLVDAIAAGLSPGGPPVVALGTARDAAPLADPVAVAPDDPAYLLFTSGSTGRPKGVEVAHRAAVATIRSLARVAPVGPDDRAIALSALDFDLSVYDLFALLSVGGAVVVPAEHERRDADRCRDLVRAHGVTVWNTVPALLDMLLTATGDGPLPLRLVLLGGDVVGTDLPARLAACAPAARLLALGGMTEATIHSTVHEARVGAPVDPASPARGLPWGEPLPGVRVRVVDERGRDRPDGVPGELLVGGHALARGYRGEPELTAQRFPVLDGARWYRSGDRARYRRDDAGRPVLESLGRADHQLKIRGHRVEPGEVEAALTSAPGVQRAVVVAVAGALAAMVVPEPGAVVAPDDVAAHAGALLPPSMACARVVVRAGLPLTANGKVDRARIVAELAERSAPALRPDDDAPRTPEERLVERVWSELLGVPCGRGRSFFAAGGDSLQATRSVAALRAAGAADASVAALFRHPVLADFAATLHLTAPGPADARARIVPDPAHRHDPFPLTDVQRAYAVGRDPRIPLGGVGTYHHTEFDGEGQDLDLLAAAFDELVRRHPTLRTVIRPDGTQRVLEEVPRVRVDVRDVPADADPDAVDAALAGFRERTSHRRHDLAVWPLFDVDALRYPDGRGGIRTRIAIGIDYAVVDALSIMILYTELDLLVRGLPLAPAPAELTFRDCVLQTRPDPERLRADEEHWRRRLAGMPDAPRLPLATADPAPRFTRRAHRFDAGWWTAFRDRCRAAGLTPTSMLATAYGHVLSRWTGQRDLTMTLTLFDRRDAHPDMPRLVGDFTALTLLDHRAAGSAAEAARGLQERLAGDLDHREAPASWILRERARLAGTAVAPVPVVFTSAIGVGDEAGVGDGDGDGVSADVSGAFGERIHGVSQSPQVLIDVQVLEDHGGLRVDADARDDAFPPGLVDALFAAYVTTLEHLATADWDAPLPVDPPADQARARTAATAAPTAPRPGRLLHDAVHEAARRAPDAPALITGTGSATRVVTHGQLADRAMRIAGALRRRGIGPGDLVGVTLPRGADQAAAVVGVLSAGAAYAPIGIGQPPVRRRAIHRAAGIRLVIADDPPAAAGDEPGAPALLRPADAAAEEPLADPVRPPVEALAYVIHTSGSTGEPKGVEITHDAAWSTVDAVSRMLEIGPGDRVLALSALDFDLSVFDVLGVLGAGGALVLPEEGEERDAPRWLDLVHEHGVTLWDTVPMLLDMLLVAADDRPGRLGSLRAALVSGDRVGTDLHGRLIRAAGPGTRLVALGGATEAAIWSNAWEVDGPLDGWQSAPYGRPLPDQAFRVLDATGRDCPDWVPGELVIGGRGLARGYRGDPARTAAAFVELGGGRWYRTGDTGRYRPGGILEFLGRADRQVKLGGHRMELGEIEAAHAASPGVRRAMALVVDGPGGRRRVHVAVEPHDGHDGAAVLAAATATAADRLPAYAMPHRADLVDAWPLTANGKVDVAALGRALADAEPDPAATAADLASASAPGTAPDTAPATGTATEAALAELWAGILGAPPAPGAGFFAAGGDSLAMLRLVTAAQRRFGVDAGVRRFLEEPTVRAYAACIDRLVATNATTTAATTTPASAPTADAPARPPATTGADLFESGDL
ncbi:amino acid adenylation domain-containing protein [Clavibacter michiganensis]|uniref:non-ribosomal peptide synthetase n=1 Tax=Clavibacter michiganensis TaxID=28447 RepID=UPI0026DD8E6A|nr:non-ribosomal peptide synthetase [Clavibacter michiganensis]MDO4075942.1 amino acid adenylation domain-containing protein [Clavibacter michiganensis]